MSLGDKFPQKFKEEYAERNIKPGAVLRCHVFDTNPPKIKRFVIIAIDETKCLLGTLYINSEINPNLFKSDYLKSLHVPIDSNGREYIDDDSYIDCTQIYIKDLNTINELLTNEPESLLGEISNTDFNIVIKNLIRTTTIPKNTKTKFGLIK